MTLSIMALKITTLHIMALMIMILRITVCPTLMFFISVTI
jgi:hypothetical protein